MSLSKIFVNNQDTGFETPLQEIGYSTTSTMSQDAITKKFQNVCPIYKEEISVTMGVYLNQITIPKIKLPSNHIFYIKVSPITAKITSYNPYWTTTSGWKTAGGITDFDNFHRILIPDVDYETLGTFGFYIFGDEITESGTILSEIGIFSDVDDYIKSSIDSLDNYVKSSIDSLEKSIDSLETKIFNFSLTVTFNGGSHSSGVTIIDPKELTNSFEYYIKVTNNTGKITKFMPYGAIFNTGESNWRSLGDFCYPERPNHKETYFKVKIPIEYRNRLNGFGLYVYPEDVTQEGNIDISIKVLSESKESESILINNYYSFSKEVKTTANLGEVDLIPGDKLPDSQDYYIKIVNTTGEVDKFWPYCLIYYEDYSSAWRNLGQLINISNDYTKIHIPDDLAKKLIGFGLYIPKENVLANGYIDIFIKTIAPNNQELKDINDELKDINERIGSISSSIDPIDNLISKTETPILSIKRDFSFASIFLNWGFVGDSLASGEHNCYNNGTEAYYDSYSCSWGQHLCRLLKVEGTNFSSGGMTTKSWIETSPYGWSLAKTQPNKSAYICALGVNDKRYITNVGNYSTDIDFSNYENNAETFVGYYAGIIQRLKSVSPRAKFFLVTIPAVENVPAYNIQIRALATVFTDVYIIDLENYAPSFSTDWSSRYRLKYHLWSGGYLYLAWLFSSYIDWIIRSNFDDFKGAGLLDSNYDYRESYSLSGQVTDGNNALANVRIAFINSNNKYYTETDSSGNYIIRFIL